MVGGLFCIVIALAVMLGFLYEPIVKSKKCTQEVQATIEEIVEGNLVVNGEPKCSAICKYYYQGVEYTEKVQMNLNKYELQVGGTKNIYINPSNPKENYIKNKGMSFANGIIVAIGSLFILVGAYIIYEDVQGNWVMTEPGVYVLKNSLEEENDVDLNIGNIETSQKPEVVGGGQAQNPEEQTSSDNGENTDATTKVNIHKVNIFKVDKNTTQMLRKSPYYVQVYKNIQADPKYKQYGSNMTNVTVKGDADYMAVSQLDRTIKEVIMYLPKDLKFVQKVGYNYYYQNNVTKSWLRVFIAPHKGNDIYARQMLNDIANYNKIIGDINIPLLSNNNAYVIFDARNANGDYLNVACSVNNKYMLYIEYNHKLGTKNNFAEIISAIKY